MTDVVPNRRESDRGIDRRTIIKGAAWAVPVMAVAVAAPLAAASVNNAGLSLTSQTGLLALNLLDGGGTVNAGALVTVPNQLVITNGAGAINQTATVTVSVARPTGINVTVGQGRGFGVYSLNGTRSTAAQRTTTYQRTQVTNQPYGFPSTTFTSTLPVNIPANGTLTVPLVMGLAGVSTGLAVSALTTFATTVTVDFGNGTQPYRATSNITVPVGAGIL